MLKSHGITAETPKNLLFSAAVLYKNLKWSETQWQGTVLGATSGGTKVSIAQEYMDAELDGATVKIKGAKNKVGEEEVRQEISQKSLKVSLLMHCILKK